MEIEKELRAELKINKEKIAALNVENQLIKGFLSIGRKCSIENNCKRLRRRITKCPKWKH
ncbi:hypothetical protein [Kordia zhangzhouensis]|uniref:hypothetical protein n=1 Tax=Kordia zhangzhouensis TaxID=1620405 RepID=UPI000629AE1F|nr:hypothetical protein [Kordia zhangzhouensis]